MTVKGAEVPCFDPRAQPGIGLGYAAAPNGPRYDALEHDLDFDPELGLPYSFPEAARIDVEPARAVTLDAGRGRRSARLLRLWSALDALNLCVFASSPTGPLTIGHLTSLVTAVSGVEFTVEDLLDAGQRRLDLMRAYASEREAGRTNCPAASTTRRSPRGRTRVRCCRATPSRGRVRPSTRSWAGATPPPSDLFFSPPNEITARIRRGRIRRTLPRPRRDRPDLSGRRPLTGGRRGIAGVHLGVDTPGEAS